MGWSYGFGDTKRDVIRYWTEERPWGEGKVGVAIKHCVRGKVLWTVHEIREKETGKAIVRFIGCFLMQTDGNGNWGYKDMEESMGPCYYSCPLAYLDMVPMPEGEYAPKWREAVREYWEKRKTIKLVEGMKMRIVAGSWKWRGRKIEEFTIRKLGRKWLAEIDGISMRFPRKMLRDAVACVN